MTNLLLTLGATAASAAVTYLLCLRPMRRGHRVSPATDAVGQELARLRREVAELRDSAEFQGVCAPGKITMTD